MCRFLSGPPEMEAIFYDMVTYGEVLLVCIFPGQPVVAARE